MSRLRSLTAALTVALAFAVAAPRTHAADAPRKIAFMEVIHSIFYSPLYVAAGRGFFAKHGLTFDFVAAQGSDKATAALLSGAADVVLTGPETSIYIQNGRSPTKIKIFAGLTATDGSFLVGCEKIANFDWSMLKGKTVLGWRKGSSPALFLDAILRKHGLDPDKDVTIVSNVAIPARMGAFMAGTADFGTFFEPDVTTIEKAGKGVSMVNVGNSLGKIDYTVFAATDDFIARNPEVISGFAAAIAEAEAWIATADPKEVAATLAPYFPGMAPDLLAETVVRHRDAGVWKTSPTVEPQAIAALQDLLVASGLLKAEERVAYEKIVTVPK